MIGSHELKITTISDQGYPKIIESGLDGKGVQLHSHAPTYAILKTHVWYAVRIKYCVVLSQLFLIHSFSIFLITLFTVSLVKSPVQLYVTFYLLLFFHIVIFNFHVAVIS